MLAVSERLLGSGRSQRPTIVICGMPRSGTTLMAEQVGRATGVAFGRETHFFPVVGGAVRRALVGRRLDGVSQALLGLSRDDACQLDSECIDQVAHRLSGVKFASVTDVFTSVLDVLHPGSRVLGEKTPRHLEYLARILRESPAAKGVVCIRDPRAVFASMKRVPWANVETLSFAARWNAYARLARRLSERLPESVQVVRYEDLVREPDQTIDATLRVLGLHRSRVIADGSSPRPTFDVTREWWKSGSDGVVHDDSIERWHSELDLDVADGIGRLTARQGQHGYELNGPVLSARSGRATFARIRFEAGLAARRSLVR